MREEPIVWVDNEPPFGRRPPAPPAPPPRKDQIDPLKKKQIMDLLSATKILAKDTMDFLLYNDSGHSEQGLHERFQVLVEEIERLERS